MNGRVSDIYRKSLETDYGVPFVVHIRDSGELAITAGPVPEYEDLFEMEAVLKHGVRLSISLLPGKYSSPLFQTMARATLEQKEQCLRYLDVIKSRAGSFEFCINDLSALDMSPGDWPTVWGKLGYSFTIFPIGECATEDEALSVVYRWLTLAFSPLFALIDIEVEEGRLFVTGYEEGESHIVATNKYERNQKNRMLCLASRGYRCAICDMDFEQEYGLLGTGYIQVHHIVPVSQIGPDYKINPVRDLIPVCPNCHAMLHRTNPPLSPDELRCMLNRQRGEDDENRNG